MGARTLNLSTPEPIISRWGTVLTPRCSAIGHYQSLAGPLAQALQFPQLSRCATMSIFERNSLWALACVCLLLNGCPEANEPRKPDPTKGTVTGVVLCTDTGKPARFAEVQLLPASMFESSGQSGKSDQNFDNAAVTGLDGRFTIEAVPPGDYYAYATLNGYLDPERAIDFSRLRPNADEDEQFADALNQWKEHFTEVTVAVQRTNDLSLKIERAAEIDGTVSYDDSSPAIGLRFQLLRKTGQDSWTGVGDHGDNGWALEEKSDSHGRFRITNLPAGEYKVCTLLPVDSENKAPRVCLGNTFRTKNAQAVKVNAGEDVGGVDIVIPLTGLYTVAGTITAGADGHAPDQATVRLLFADDRQQERETGIWKDGGFAFKYVPADNYIVQITDAQDKVTPHQTAASTGPAPQGQTEPETHHYPDKEVSLSVQSDMNNVDVSLTEPLKPEASSQ